MGGYQSYHSNINKRPRVASNSHLHSVHYWNGDSSSKVKQTRPPPFSTRRTPVRLACVHGPTLLDDPDVRMQIAFAVAHLRRERGEKYRHGIPPLPWRPASNVFQDMGHGSSFAGPSVVFSSGPNLRIGDFDHGEVHGIDADLWRVREVVPQ